VQPYYQDDAVTIYHGDCREILPTLGMVDHVITDPPYEAEAHTKGRRIANPRTGEIRVASLSFDPMTPDTRGFVGAEFARLSRRWILVFCQIEAAMIWRAVVPSRYIRTMVWAKPNGQPQLTGDRPGVGFESIVVCHAAGACRWNGGGKRGWLTYPVDANFSRTPRYHETQKPEPLMEDLIADFTDPGETILDPFMGSGTTLVAAKRLGRKAIGIELNEKYCDIAIRRLAQAVLPLEQPPAPVQAAMFDDTDAA
jgi:hypothetical protein